MPLKVFRSCNTANNLLGSCAICRARILHSSHASFRCELDAELAFRLLLFEPGVRAVPVLQAWDPHTSFLQRCVQERSGDVKDGKISSFSWTQLTREWERCRCVELNLGLLALSRERSGTRRRVNNKDLSSNPYDQRSCHRNHETPMTTQPPKP